MKHNVQTHHPRRVLLSVLSVWLMHSASHGQTPPRQPDTARVATDLDAQVEAGFQIILDRQSGNCLTCHALSTTQLTKLAPKGVGMQGNFGPPLDGVGARYNTTTLLQWVTDARKIKPDTLMPPYGSIEGLNLANGLRPLLTHEQRQAVAAALSTLQ